MTDQERFAAAVADLKRAIWAERRPLAYYLITVWLVAEAAVVTAWLLGWP